MVQKFQGERFSEWKIIINHTEMEIIEGTPNELNSLIDTQRKEPGHAGLKLHQVFHIAYKWMFVVYNVVATVFDKGYNGLAHLCFASPCILGRFTIDEFQARIQQTNRSI